MLFRFNTPEAKSSWKKQAEELHSLFAGHQIIAATYSYNAKNSKTNTSPNPLIPQALLPTVYLMAAAMAAKPRKKKIPFPIFSPFVVLPSANFRNKTQNYR
ncbi:MAG: hypothetical protein U0T74_12920 [Chitinophagales bacterium]